MKLVDGRECGSCTVCCTVTPVVTSVVRKGPNTPCPQCTGGGCGIYPTRPQECRESFCGWRAYAELDDAWRPDLSGVLILTEPDPPPPWSGRTGLKFMLVKGDEPLSTDRLAGYIIALVTRNIPVSVAIQGPPGHWPVKTFVNGALAEPIKRYDVAEVKATLMAIVRNLRAGPFERAELPLSLPARVRSA